jgi:hypothetical protein
MNPVPQQGFGVMQLTLAPNSSCHLGSLHPIASSLGTYKISCYSGDKVYLSLLIPDPQFSSKFFEGRGYILPAFVFLRIFTMS